MAKSTRRYLETAKNVAITCLLNSSKPKFYSLSGLSVTYIPILRPY